VSSTSLDSRAAVSGSAQEILARLERYAATHGALTVERPTASRRLPPVPALVARGATPAVTAGPTHAPRVNPATVDLFPYDLAASIVGCVITIMAYVSFGRPVAIALTAGLAACGEIARRLRWFPSVGVNLVIGTLAGVLFVITA
jgi:hypothetical protein